MDLRIITIINNAQVIGYAVITRLEIKNKLVLLFRKKIEIYLLLKILNMILTR